MSKHQGRRVPPLDPTTIDRSSVKTALPNDADWDTAESLRTLDANQIAAGVAQNRETGLYHTWISLYGSDLSSWYVGDDGPTARAFLLAIQKLYAEWSHTTTDVERMNALVELAAEKSTAPQATLPDAQVRELLAEVARRQQRKN